MRWKHRIRIGKGNSMKVQLYLGYSVLLAFLAGLIGVFLFLGMRTLVMNQIGQSRLDVLKQVSERSNIVKTASSPFPTFIAMMSGCWIALRVISGILLRRHRPDGICMI